MTLEFLLYVSRRLSGWDVDFCYEWLFQSSAPGPGASTLLPHLDTLGSRTFLDPLVELMGFLQGHLHNHFPPSTHTWFSQHGIVKQNYCSHFKGEETNLGDQMSHLRQLS